MKINKVAIRNFRRLENVEIDFEDRETVFVGPNNSGKTSATSAFKLFLKNQNFAIHDFSVSRIADIDAIGRGDNDRKCPKIEMDLWVSIDPNIEYGRSSALLLNISAGITTVGVQIQFAVKDLGILIKEYHSAFPENGNGCRARTLSYFLSMPNNLSRHFTTVYSVLEDVAGVLKTHHMDPDEARKTLTSLIRVDFVDAQRNIDDHEASRSTRLSQAFASYYQKNLQQSEVNEEANRVIEENNDNLNEPTGHALRI